MKDIKEFLNKVICGDVLKVLKEIPADSIDLGITSPPYNKKEKHGGWLVPTMEWLTKTKWNIWQEIIWNRKIAGNIRGWRFWQVEERIYWLVKGKPKLTSIWEMRPFCGTGTTFVSAKLLGKHYIGIDISPDYTAYAEKRLMEAEKEKYRVLKEISLHTTELTFEERKKRGMWSIKIKHGR
ncbi:MAG: DNA methyltransferase [Hydrogenobacter sp.]|uniref:DNA methyltransferase n=1 Tax=Hydrogenobacter thermophilus TaxID=940 RepID=UPI0030FBFEF0